MNRTLQAALLSLPLLALSAAATAEGESDAGQKLHDAHCTSCHDSSVYTRADHRVQDLAGLQQQVRHCEVANSLDWSDKDIDAVADYLNRSYYKF